MLQPPPMTLNASQPLMLQATIEKWPLATPFRFTGYTFHTLDVLVVRLEQEGRVGWGEAAGVYYRGDTPVAMIKQVEGLRGVIEAGIDRESLQRMLPPGGARNALDCALWDLEAKTQGVAVWQLAGLDKPRPLLTTFTCGIDEPDAVAAKARSYASARAIKLKLSGEPLDIERVRAVRSAREDVWLGVDANQGLTPSSLDRLMPALLEARVALIEQPFPVGEEALLDGFQSPIPIAADESVQSRADIAEVAGRFNVVNVKLDKCGGLTEGLAMVRALAALGIDAMVGNMLGTSLAMAPSFLLGQLCRVVDLDGPILLGSDRATRAQYADGLIMCPEALWGAGGEDRP
jgi:L-Ala-D/L-Glu epimerase